MRFSTPSSGIRRNIQAPGILRGEAAASVLFTAQAYWKANRYSGSGKLLNLTGNTAHDAQFGSTSGSDTNDPLYLPLINNKPYFYSPGATGNYAYILDAANQRFLSDCRFIANIGLSDWTPAGRNTISGKFTSSSGYIFRVTAAGELEFLWFDSGTGTTRTLTSTAAIGIADGSPIWVRLDFDADNGAVGCTAKFYTSTNYDPVTETGNWTQLGADVTVATVAAITSSTADFVIAARNTSTTDPLTGNIMYVRAYNAIDGTGLVVDVDFTKLVSYNATYTTLMAISGQTVNIVRNATGRKSCIVSQPLFLMGTDDFFEIPDNANLDFVANDNFTIIMLVRGYNWAQTHQLMWKSAAVGGKGWIVQNTFANGLRFILDDSVTSGSENNSSPSTGVLTSVAAIRTGASCAIYKNGVSDGATNITAGALDNASVVRIGAISNSTTSTFEGEFFGAAIFRRALTASELALATLDLLT